MPSIIIFSKDRPMQLHAYLESLLLFSDAREEDITVLYFEIGGIDYSRVVKAFPAVNWVPETDFYSNLVATLDKAEPFTMFGCDDVVFTGSFSLKEAADALEADKACFGFSLRLGKNIKPLPKKISKQRAYLKWEWSTKRAHYNYPWELDATLYRKADILGILSTCKQKINNPNYLEANISLQPREFISRPCMMCFNDTSKAIVITVNRVQDTHCNPFDAALDTDVKTLNTLYNEEGKGLDIQTIAKMKSRAIHVGTEFFKLKTII